MPVTDTQNDSAARTFTLTAVFDAPPERVWDLWRDPRKLERWWGPPSYPATFTSHELTPGSHTAYFMTAPSGDRHHGWWRVESVDPPNGLTFSEGFANADGSPNEDMPATMMTVALTPEGGHGTRMVITATFPTDEALQQLSQMGMEEGMREAVNQMDALLAEV